MRSAKAAEAFAVAEGEIGRVAVDIAFVIGARLDFVLGQPLELAVVALAQTGLGLHRQPQQLGRRRGSIVGTLQIAAVKGRKVIARPGLGPPPGPAEAAGGIERDVDLPLNAALRIPVSFAVANDAHSGG